MICREPVDPPEEEEEKTFVELELTATAYVGQLKDKIHKVVGKCLKLDEEDVSQLPRMPLTSGRKVWPDTARLRTIVRHVGGTAGLKYGSLDVVFEATDLRDPPRRSPEEETELERVRVLHEMQVLQDARTRRTRPKKSLLR